MRKQIEKLYRKAWGRRLLSLALCVVMFTSLVPAAFASQDFYNPVVQHMTTNSRSLYKDSTPAQIKAVIDGMFANGKIPYMLDKSYNVNWDEVDARSFYRSSEFDKYREQYGLSRHGGDGIIVCDGSAPNYYILEDQDFYIPTPSIRGGEDTIKGKYKTYFLEKLLEAWWTSMSQEQQWNMLNKWWENYGSTIPSTIDVDDEDLTVVSKFVAYQGVSLFRAPFEGSMRDAYAAIVNGEEFRKEEAEKNTVDLTKNTYLLRVDTGILSGDNVLYLGIRYRDVNGEERTEFLFPNEGSLSEGYRLAESFGNPQDRINTVHNVTGYQVSNAYGNQKGLRSNSTDTYLFQTDYELAECLSIDVMMRYTTGGKGWTCKGIYLYKVSGVYGVEMAGYYSDNYYISFAGEMLVKLKEDTVNFELDQSDRMFRITEAESNLYTLQKIDANDEMRQYDSRANTYLFKVDFADTYKAGIESLAARYGDERRLRQVAEALTLNVTYIDTYGKNRTISMPMITSTIAWLVETGMVSEELPIAGIAQQGESILFPGTLPEFRELKQVTVTYGRNAATKAGITGDAGTIREERLSSLNNDTISITGLQIYNDDVDVTVRVTPTDETGKSQENAATLQMSVASEYHPLYYFAWTDPTGFQIKPGESNLTSRITQYVPGSKIESLELNTAERYLVEIDTDDPARAGTEETLYLCLGYICDGIEVQSPTIDLKDGTTEFYGYWPGKTGDAAYQAGAGAGGTMRCIVTLDKVQRFTKATLSLGGAASDDWQMKAIRIYALGGLGKRSIVWEDSNISDRMITREIKDSDIRLLAQYPNALDETERQVTENGDEIIPDKVYLNSAIYEKTILFGDSSRSVIEEKPRVDWNEIRYSMSFEDTMQDLGFVNTASTYQVDVKVASNSQAGGADDCGSNNLFYFRLVFEGGSSGYVLANQQLTADGFRADRVESFDISTNEDYGALEAIYILPETDSGSDNHDPYDKLNISSITVTQKSTESLQKSWTFNNVGWVDVHLEDKRAESAIGGREGRSEAEMVNIYASPASGYSLNLVVAMTTGSYDRDIDDVNASASDENPQFVGSLVATVEYYDQNNTIRQKSIDVVKAMYEYNLQTPEYYNGETFASSGGMTEHTSRSDPDTMFRGEHTDRFFMSLTDVKQLIRMRFGASMEQGKGSALWKLSDVSVFEIQKAGMLQINADDEYEYSGEYKRIWSSTDDMGYTLKLMAPETKDQLLGPQQQIPVTFNKNEYLVDKTEAKWISKIDPVPTSNTDTLNMYVYMKEGPLEPPASEYNLSLQVKWKSRGSQTTYQDTIFPTEKTTITGTEGQAANHRTMFYYTGLNTPGLGAVSGFSWDYDILGSVNPHVDYAIVQHLRSGVVINTYIYTGSGLAQEVKRTTQTVKLQLSPDTAETLLEKDICDLAVGFTYQTESELLRCESLGIKSSRTAENEGGSSASITGKTHYEFMSTQYVKDENGNPTNALRYQKVKPGMIVEIPFQEKDLGKITGLIVGKVGGLQATVDSAYICEYAGDTCIGWYNFAEVTELDLTPTEIGETISQVMPVHMELITDGEARIASSGSTNGDAAPIRMTMTYVNSLSNLREDLVIDDIHTYMNGGFREIADGKYKAELDFLGRNIGAIRYITLEPYAEDASSSAMFNLYSVSCSETVNMTEKQQKKTFTTPVLVLQEAPVSVNLSTIVLTLKAQTPTLAGTVTNEPADAKNPAKVTILPGKSVSIITSLTGSMDGYGFKVSTVRRVGAEGSEIVNCHRINGSEIIVTPPDNYGTEPEVYVVTVSSEEAPTDVFAQVIITVPVSEIEPEENSAPSEGKDDSSDSEKKSGGGEETPTAGGESAGE